MCIKCNVFVMFQGPPRPSFRLRSSSLAAGSCLGLAALLAIFKINLNDTTVFMFCQCGELSELPFVVPLPVTDGCLSHRHSEHVPEVGVSVCQGGTVMVSFVEEKTTSCHFAVSAPVAAVK